MATVPLDYLTTEEGKIKLSFTIEETKNYKKKFGTKNFYLILNREAVIGMTRDMCSLSWGLPQKINETVTGNKISEQWVYSRGYLYFDNGILTAVQNR